MKTKETNERLIEKLAAHVSVNRAPLQTMPPQPALELASAAVRATHELREECRKLGVEYSISECAEQLADKVQAAHECK